MDWTTVAMTYGAITHGVDYGSDDVDWLSFRDPAWPILADPAPRAADVGGDLEDLSTRAPPATQNRRRLEA